MVEIVPSILSADFARLADDIAKVEAGGVRMTGSARAESFRSPPQPRMTNIRIELDDPWSPEQAEARTDLDGRADLYALGLVLYELACGVSPYVADDVPQAAHRLADGSVSRLAGVRAVLAEA